MEVFKKEYDGESIVDVRRDVFEAFDADFNPFRCRLTCKVTGWPTTDSAKEKKHE